MKARVIGQIEAAKRWWLYATREFKLGEFLKLSVHSEVHASYVSVPLVEENTKISDQQRPTFYTVLFIVSLKDGLIGGKCGKFDERHYDAPGKSV